MHTGVGLNDINNLSSTPKNIFHILRFVLHVSIDEKLVETANVPFVFDFSDFLVSISEHDLDYPLYGLILFL